MVTDDALNDRSRPSTGRLTHKTCWIFHFLLGVLLLMASTLALIIVKNKLLVIPMLIGFLCMLFGGSYIIHADDRR